MSAKTDDPARPATRVLKWTLGDRLRKAREEAGISRLEMAKALEVSRGTITNYEHGHVSVPIEKIRGYARLTGFDVECLIGDAAEVPGRLRSRCSAPELPLIWVHKGDRPAPRSIAEAAGTVEHGHPPLALVS